MRISVQFFVVGVVLAAGCAASSQNYRYGEAQGFESPIREGTVIYVERELPFSVDRVWDTVFADFAGVAKFHPHFVGSGYLDGTDQLALGAERYCHTEEDGSEGVHERVIYLDEENKEVQFQIFEAFGVPVDTESTFGTSQLIALDEQRTLFRLRFVLNTSPGFLVWFAKGSVREELTDMTIGMEHYLATGETVSEENLERVKLSLAAK
ncbi:MAG: SRPBCC family protein [Myxococcota bacterium]